MKNTFIFISFFAVSLNLYAEHSHEMEEVLVTGAIAKATSPLLTTSGADSGALLRSTPGANINKNGELTSIAQYRGMFGDRVNVAIDGNPISSGGPNAMDSPLSYAPAPMLESLTVYRGIAPVSAGQETIGGSIQATTTNSRGQFSESDNVEFSGAIELMGQTVNDGNAINTLLNVANQQHSATLNWLTQNANDAKFADGKIIPSEYERDRYDLSYNGRSDDSHWHLQAGNNDTGHSGTPALPMDIIYIDSDIYSAGFDTTLGNTSLQFNSSYNDIEHKMNNFTLRTAMAGMSRETLATGENRSAKLLLETSTQNALIRYGVDANFTEHTADVSDPNNPMFFVNNFNAVERDVLGVFAEIETNLNSKLRIDSGLRINQVTMDANEVNCNMCAMPGMMQNLRDAFNSADRSHTDTNIDAVLKTTFSVNNSVDLLAGIAQKSRSASYQERYLWMPMQATGGLADGNTYVGNLELDPEISREIELGLDFHSSNFNITPRIFYKDIKDYIMGTPAMMSNLQFNNVDASIYGFDLDTHYQATNAIALRGVLSYVRGKRDDINDDLYRIPPLTLTWAIDYSNDLFTTTLENRLAAQQNKVSNANSANPETKTAGYGIINLYTTFNLDNELQIILGLENLGDKKYYDHLGGVNRVMNNPDIANGDKLPGLGRNAYLKVKWIF